MPSVDDAVEVAAASREPSVDRDDPGDWVVLAGGGSSLKQEKEPSTGGAVLQFVLIAALLVASVGIAGAFVIKSVAESQSVRDVAELTNVLGQSVVQPALTNDMVDDPSRTTQVLDRVLRPSLSNRLLLRVKVWTTGGRVLYSDEPRLIGKTFPLDDEAREALDTPRTAADLSNLNRPENRYERGQGKLLEVYRPIWTPDGHELLLKTYFR